MRRRPEEERWGKDDANDVNGTPSNPRPGKEGARIPIRIETKEETRQEAGGEGQGDGKNAPRRAYLRRSDYEEHGYTPGCEGCVKMANGVG